ncbi:sulfotransferase [Desulfosporosinus sp. OT]|uniref:sulfotransferase family protein n=1 Tax=Desulfosporosinus sp. OT TaxID=913865 RepID=UPI000223A56C|nr:sulfotransferase [Desulfosporosinus sp. OT]EGW41266.1 sulfotransferase domain protein [Desulfosporosinus sp. OT]
MTDKTPNLFIVGAAKSATTSLYYYLQQHPDIFFCEPKEPKFYSYKYNKFPHRGPGDKRVDDFVVRDYSKYLSLFSSVASEKIIAEASVDYLYFYESAKDIKKDNPEAKIIIILRNPVDRALSAYSHLRKDMRESLSFENALELEQERIDNNYEFIWHYKEVGLYSSQVKTYIDVFGRSSVRIILFEELKKDVSKVLREILEFLGLKPDFEFSTTNKYNISGIPKNTFLNKVILKPNLIKELIKKTIPKETLKYLQLKKSNYLKKKLVKQEIEPDLKDKLISFYKKDILNLEELIDKDLSGWLKNNSK